MNTTTESRTIRIPGMRDAFEQAMRAEAFELEAELERRDRLYDLAVDSLLAAQFSDKQEEPGTL